MSNHDYKSNTRHAENLKLVETIQPNITNLFEVSKMFHLIGHRGDLNEENAMAFGNIDMKLFSAISSSDTEFLSFSGPLRQKSTQCYTPPQAQNQFKENEECSSMSSVPQKAVPFSWSSVSHLHVQHEGLPEKFDFGFVSPKWAWI